MTSDGLESNRGRTVRILLWTLVWAAFAIFSWTYLRTLRTGAGSIFRQPMHTARKAYAASMDFCDDDPAGRRVLEAENAQAAGDWTVLNDPTYSGHAARKTTQTGATLTWDISIPAGTYDVILLCGSATAASSARVSIGDQDFVETWK